MIWNIYITIILPKQPPHSTNMSNLSEQWVTLSDRAFSLLSNANQSPWFKTLHTDTSYLIARNKSLMIVQIWPTLKRKYQTVCVSDPDLKCSCGAGRQRDALLRGRPTINLFSPKIWSLITQSIMHHGLWSVRLRGPLMASPCAIQ